jgi:hypothetical protein
MSSLDRPVFVRRSDEYDLRALAHLAGLGGKRAAPTGRYLVAEVGGTMVAAVPLDDDAVGPLSDQSPESIDVTILLTRWAANLRRQATPELRRKAA